MVTLTHTQLLLRGISDPCMSWSIRAVYCELILHVHLDVDPHLRVPARTNARLWGEIPDQVVAADYKRDAVPGSKAAPNFAVSWIFYCVLR